MKRFDIDDEELLKLVAQQESATVMAFDQFEDRLLVEMESQGLRGDKLPWPKTHGTVALGAGELSIWAGVNGSGKSAMVSQLIVSLAQHRNTLTASMEMPAERTLKIMATQAAGCYPSKEYAIRYINSTKGWIYDCLDKVSEHKILGLAYYAGKNLGVTHLVIDSLTMTGVKTDDYEAQTRFIDHLRCAAKRHRMHIHLVCHMRKGDREGDRVSKWDIRGAGQITDMADKCFIVARNKKREHAKARQEHAPNSLTDAERELIANGYDTFLQLEKNRQDGTEATWGLFFNPESKQFTEREGRPVTYVD